MVNIMQNTAAKKMVEPALSILIPFYHDDPAALLGALALQTQELRTDVEILIYDDGTNDKTVNDNLVKIASESRAPISLYFAQDNHGRAHARNALKEKARALWVLFLDADMLPTTDNFIAGYLTEIIKDETDILFGGFTVPDQKQSAETELHRAFSHTSDCLGADERTKNGPQYVCSSNLCVRASVLNEQPFDTNFQGWGWEDSEWAARVASVYRLKHVDLPALHLGLENTETLLKRFKDSGENYVRFTSKHPELAKTLTLYKMSHKLKRLPGQALMRPFLAFTVRSNFMPTKLRLLALKLWRASWYAKALS